MSPTRAARGLRLIVNADDCGLTHAITAAILRAHGAGVVTTASVVVTTPAFDDAVERLHATPTLRTGLHLALVGGDRPAADPARIRSLVDDEGRLHVGWRDYLARAATGRIDHREVRVELEAQYERARGAGLVLDHLDSHQNVHLWPATAAVVVELARTWGIRAVRTPRSRSMAPPGLVVRVLGRRLRRRLDRAGCRTSDQMIGFDHADAYADHLADDLRWLRAAASAHPGLVAELALHLSQPDDEELAAYGWGYDYAGALDAVLRPEVAAELRHGDIELVTWADVAGS